MNRGDGLLAALVVSSLAAAAAVWAPALRYSEPEPPHAARLLNTATPAPSTPPKPASPPTPTPSPTKTKAVPETNWATETEKAYLQKSKLYTAGRVPAVACPLPSARQTSKSAVLARAKVIVKCLDRAWTPLIARTGNYFESPKVVVYTRTKSVKVCGVAPVAYSTAFYCPDEQTIYLEWQGYLEDGDRTWAEVDLISTMGHEYGHHLQYVVGIGALTDRRQEDEPAAVQLEISRRLELQASCLGAAFTGANKVAFGLTGERLRTWNLQSRQGDDVGPKSPRDHGSANSNQYWIDLAFRSANPSSCNTWAAPAGRVS